MDFSNLVNSLQSSTNALSQLGHTFLNIHSFLLFIILTIAGLIVGNIMAVLLQRLSLVFGNRADKSTNLRTVTFMRRIETMLILSMALVRLIFVLVGLYIWWIVTHAGQQPSALIGASALVLVVAYGLSGPLLRDVAFGGGMMAEQWFGVGDIVTLQPNNMQGVVERITLRSTKIRGFSGETIWYSNQNINMVSVVRRGTWVIALEIFVSDPKQVDYLIHQTNRLLPKGPSLLISPLEVKSIVDEGHGIWHVLAIGETAPGQDYLLRSNAIDILKKLDIDSKQPIILTDIVARFADKNTEIKLARAVHNARKTRKIRTKIVTQDKADKYIKKIKDSFK